MRNGVQRSYRMANCLENGEVMNILTRHIREIVSAELMKWERREEDPRVGDWGVSAQ